MEKGKKERLNALLQVTFSVRHVVTPGKNIWESFCYYIECNAALIGGPIILTRSIFGTKMIQDKEAIEAQELFGLLSLEQFRD